MKIQDSLVYALIFLVVVLAAIPISMVMTGYDDVLPDIPESPDDFSYVGDSVGNFTLTTGWQLISMPDNINKTDIFITYENESYTWTEAFNNNLIANVVVEYNGNGYSEVDYLLKTRGYWMYSFVDGIQISDMPSVIYCGKLFTGYSNMSNITCSKVVIAPEFYDNDIYCNTFVATDFYEFYYDGGEVLS